MKGKQRGGGCGILHEFLMEIEEESRVESSFCDFRLLHFISFSSDVQILFLKPQVIVIGFRVVLLELKIANWGFWFLLVFESVVL